MEEEDYQDFEDRLNEKYIISRIIERGVLMDLESVWKSEINDPEGKDQYSKDYQIHSLESNLRRRFTDWQYSYDKENMGLGSGTAGEVFSRLIGNDFMEDMPEITDMSGQPSDLGVRFTKIPKNEDDLGEIEVASYVGREDDEIKYCKFVIKGTLNDFKKRIEELSKEQDVAREEYYNKHFNKETAEHGKNLGRFLLKTPDRLFDENFDLVIETEDKINALINHPAFGPNPPLRINESVLKYLKGQWRWEGNEEAVKEKGLESLGWLEFMRQKRSIERNYTDMQAFDRVFDARSQPDSRIFNLISEMCNNRFYIMLSLSEESKEDERYVNTWIENSFGSERKDEIKKIWNEPVAVDELDGVIKYKDGKSIKGRTVGDVLVEIASMASNESFRRMLLVDAEELEAEEIKNKLARQLSNAVVPWQSLVRYPENSEWEKIEPDYLSNMADLSIFLQSSFNDGEFREILKDPEKYNSWFMECHRIACEGVDGLKLYVGNSMVRLSDEFPGKLRGEMEVKAQIPNARKYFEKAEEYGEPNPYSTEEYKSWEKTFPSGGKLKEARNMWFGCAEFEFPPSDVLPENLEKMRNYMEKAYGRLVEDPEDKEAWMNLGKVFQMGIQSQISETVLQSVLMAQVNEMLALTGKPRVAHDNLDGYAYVLEQDHFGDYFYDYLMNTGQKIEVAREAVREEVTEEEELPDWVKSLSVSN